MADVRTIAVRNPRTGAAEFSFSPATAEEVARKAARLRNNQKKWAARPVQERIGITDGPLALFVFTMSLPMR